MIRIGIDLGGTKIEAIALDDSGEIRFRRRVATPDGDYPGILQRIVELVATCERELAVHASVGVGTPGALSATSGLLKNSNSICLNGKPILHDLKSALARDVRLTNDANCFALSEATDGAAADANVVFGVIVGTGTGAGIVIDRHPLIGANAIAGEWGHNPLPWPTDAERPGPPCYCGKHGCIETFLSGPGMGRDHTDNNGEPLDAQQIVQRATAGDAACTATLERYVDRMARALAHVINILDPDVIVLGGGMSNIDRLYATVPQQWGRYVFSDTVDTALRRPRHGDSSGVRGAAWLWDETMLSGTP